MRSRNKNLILFVGLLAAIAAILALAFQFPSSVPPPGAADLPPTASATPEMTPDATPDRAPSEEAPPVPPDPDMTPPYLLRVRALMPDGAPAKGAAIHVLRVLADSAESGADAVPALEADENGEAVHRFADPGPFIAWCVLDSHAAEARFDFRRNAAVHLDLVLGLAARVAGRTVDAAGRGLPDVRVDGLLRGETAESAVSDGAGRFVFSRAVPLPVRLRGEAEGYPPVVIEHTDPGAEAVLRFARGGQLLATVLDRDSGAPAGAFPLGLRPAVNSGLPAYTGVADRAGVVRIDAIAAGTYTLHANDPARSLSNPGASVAIVDGKTARIEILAEPGGRIAGRVFDEQTGAGISGVQVLVTYLGDTGRTGAAPVTGSGGDFEAASLPAGPYTLGIKNVPPRYGGQTHEHAIVETRELALEPGEQKGGVLFPLRARTPLEGRVEFTGGLPAPGATVSASVPAGAGAPPGAVSWAVETVSGPDGRFALYDVPEKPLTLRAQWRGFASDVLGPLSPAAHQQSEVVLTLEEQPTGTLAGQVLDADGQPVRAHVHAAITGGQSGSGARLAATTGADGRFLFTEAPAGEYEFLYGAHRSGLVDYSHSDGPYALNPGQTLTGITLHLTRDGLALTGVVRDSQGELLPNYMIDVEGWVEEEGFRPFSTAITDDAGRFIVENLAEGEYQLRPYGSNPGNWRMRVMAGEEIEIVLPNAAAQDPPP